MEPLHLPGWNFCFTTPVRFRDIDMFDHVNNAVYLTYVESARVAYYSQVTGLQDPHDFDMTVARVEIDFKKPIFFPATINVFTRACRIGVCLASLPTAATALAPPMPRSWRTATTDGSFSTMPCPRT